jgi:hypothetical protein
MPYKFGCGAREKNDKDFKSCGKLFFWQFCMELLEFYMEQPGKAIVT